MFLLMMVVLTANVRKDVPGLIMFADGILLCGDDETDMTEYLKTWRRALEGRANTHFIDFKFGRVMAKEKSRSRS